MNLLFDLKTESLVLEKFLKQNQLYISDTPSYCLLDKEEPVYMLIYKYSSKVEDLFLGRASIVYEKDKDNLFGFNISMKLNIIKAQEFLK